MTLPRSASPRRWRAILVAALACGTAITLATAAEFSQTLSPAQLAGTGVATLTAVQQKSLDAMVAREQQAARQGGVRAFAGTFVSRRTVEERQQAGLDQLSDNEKDTLNDTVATAIANQQPAPLPVSALRQSQPETESRASRLQVHGEVTLTYGTGKGGSYHAASLYTEMTDPDRKITIGVGLGTFRGNGWLRRCGYFDDGYYNGW